MRKNTYKGLAVLVVILLAIPFVAPNNYYLDMAVRILINSVIVISLNLLVGYAGQISLGHAGFVGIGAYSSAVLPAQLGWHPMLALLAGATFTAVLALLVARPILRLKGYYLAMATLGLGIIVNIILRNEIPLTGGPDGIGVPTMELFGYALSTDLQWYWVSAGLLVLCVIGCINLIDSPFGRALRGVHGSEVASRSVGIDATRYKTIVFVVSAVMASVMGSVLAHYVGFITPDLSSFFESIELITMVIVGGMASIFGSILGAALLTALPQLLATLEGWETIVFGLILIVCLIFLPRGLLPTIAERFGRKED